MSEKKFTPSGDDWEEKLVEQLTKMFQDMGMPIDSNTLRTMMNQIQSQFDEMGIDPEKMVDGKVELNLEATMNDIAKMMGGKSPQQEPVEVEIETKDEVADSELMPVNEDDIFINDDLMILTIDCSRIADIDDSGNGVEIILTSDKSVLSMMVEGRPRPVKKFNLGRVVTNIEEWSINNGILDMTLKI